VITGALLSDLAKARGDSALGAQYIDTAIKLAHVARVEDVLGFAKAPPAGVQPGGDTARR
jgi:hypothetical protein